MNILIVNGSPKGKYSTTLQTCLYLQILHSEHNFEFLNAALSIKSFEKDFSAAAEKLTSADLIIFSYPVYTFLVPSQLHRFIELIKENGIDLSGKFATQITTSKHFYDITAHAFIEDNVFDLNMKYIKGLSADMDDLTHKKGQKDADEFFEYVIWSVEHNLYEPIPPKSVPNTVLMSADIPVPEGNKKGDIVIVADLSEDDTALRSMINRFISVSPYNTRVVNIHEFPFKGGCISCFNCATSGQCFYKDGFQDLLRNNIQSAEAIIIAFTIKDHSMGSLFKTYDDRQFCNGHRTVTMGLPFGYIVNGYLSREENLRTVINARAEVGGNFLAGIASNEYDVNSSIDSLSKRLSYAISNRYTQPSNFYGVGGMKIFRDLIWLMQGMMKADHKFYASHGQYDFPQKKFGTMLSMYLVGGLIGNPKIKAKLGNKMNEGMIAPYTKVLEQAKNDRK